MFADHEAFTPPGAPPPVAKRGNLIFARNGYTFVISTELSERVTEGTSYHNTTAEEDSLLRSRLLDITKKMTFIKPAPPK